MFVVSGSLLAVRCLLMADGCWLMAAAAGS